MVSNYTSWLRQLRRRRAATEKRAGDRLRKESANKNGCCLFRGIMVRKDHMPSQHDLSLLPCSVLAQAHSV
jgi:hypothetical protein